MFLFLCIPEQNGGKIPDLLSNFCWQDMFNWNSGTVSTNVLDYSQQTKSFFKLFFHWNHANKWHISNFIDVVLKDEVELQIVANKFSSENEKYLRYFDI